MNRFGAFWRIIRDGFSAVCNRCLRFLRPVSPMSFRILAYACVCLHETSPKSVDELKVCRSPVSGIVIRITAQVGRSLQTGDVLLVLEAMKMETNITAPGPGKIGAIPVNVGDSVQHRQVLVEFE